MKDLLKKYNKDIVHANLARWQTLQLHGEWFTWRSSSPNTSILSLLYANISSCKQFYMRKALSESRVIFSLYIFVWFNVIHVLWWRSRARKQDKNEAGLPFSLSSATRKVRDYCILERIAPSKAYLQAESNTEWMDGARIYKRNTSSEYLYILWPLASQEILVKGFSFPIWCHLYTCSS